jgi:hypothetical protein
MKIENWHLSTSHTAFVAHCTLKTTSTIAEQHIQIALLKKSYEKMTYYGYRRLLFSMIMVTFYAILSESWTYFCKAEKTK